MGWSSGWAIGAGGSKAIRQLGDVIPLTVKTASKRFCMIMLPRDGSVGVYTMYSILSSSLLACPVSPGSEPSREPAKQPVLPCTGSSRHLPTCQKARTLAPHWRIGSGSWRGVKRWLCRRLETR